MSKTFQEIMAGLNTQLRERCEAKGAAFPPESCRCIPCWAAAVIEKNVIARAAP